MSDDDDEVGENGICDTMVAEEQPVFKLSSDMVGSSQSFDDDFEMED